MFSAYKINVEVLTLNRASQQVKKQKLMIFLYRTKIAFVSLFFIKMLKTIKLA